MYVERWNIIIVVSCRSVMDSWHDAQYIWYKDMFYDLLSPSGMMGFNIFWLAHYFCLEKVVNFK